MSNYTQVNDYSAKDALATGDPNKKILGSDIDDELAGISTAIASKADDSAVVHNTGTETIAGDKTFSGNTAFSGTASMTAKSMYWAKGADVASANPLVVGTDGNYFDVTGTTGFASMTVTSGLLFMLQFDGALVLTHHATNLNLPGGANITTATGDRMICFATGANTVHVLDYVKASGLALSYPSTSGCSMTFIESKTASASASLSFTGLVSTYDEYLVIAKNIIPATNGAGLQLNYSVNNGVSYEAGANDYPQASLCLGSDGTGYNSVSAGTTNLILNGTGLGVENSAAAGGWCGEIRFFNLSAANVVKKATWHGSYPSNSAAGLIGTITGSGYGGSATMQTNDIDAINFQFSAGNITSGTLYLYGIKKS